MLIYGSLLCLSGDRFTTNKMFAVIAERKAEQMEKGKILCFSPLQSTQLQLQMRTSLL